MSAPHSPVRDLFAGVVFYLHDTIHPVVRLALRTLLVESGATECPPCRPNRFDTSKLTHFVTDTLDFPEHALLTRRNAPDSHSHSHSDPKGKGTALERGAPDDDHVGDGKIKIVLPAWVTRSFDLQALQQSRFYSPDPALFLSSTCICTTGLPIADDLTICAAVEAFGGQWRRELTREVTHLISVAAHGKKYDMAVKFGTELGIAIVLPHWFEESLKLNQLVPMDVYRFPDPPYSTSLRDPRVSTKPFVERLTDYWKLCASAASTSTSGGSGDATNVVTTPTTATHTILGLGEGCAVPTRDRLRDSEEYFRSTTLEGFPSEQLERDVINASTLRGGPASQQHHRRGSSSKLDSTLSTAAADDDHEHGGRGRGGGRDAGAGQIFAGKRFYLASDLGLSRGIERAIAAKIAAFGGTAWSFGLDGDRRVDGDDGAARDNWARRRAAERELRAADYVVLRNREGWEYWLAYATDRAIGTPPWLFYQFAHHRLTSPLARLVHYPPPSRDGVAGFRTKVITVSNYTGLAREYVRTLVETLGAKYEGTMGRQTDYVVTASDVGSKCSHAKQWAIPLVTHVWLEACVLAWDLVDPALAPAYTVHATAHGGTLFPTVLGSTPWTRAAIRAWAESDERRDEREHGSRSVAELERLERERDADMDLEERGADGDEGANEDEDDGGGFRPDDEDVKMKPVDLDDAERRAAAGTSVGNGRGTATAVKPSAKTPSRATAMDVEDAAPSPPRGTSKSAKPPSPPPPPVREVTPPARVAKPSKRTKARDAPRADGGDSSALTEDDQDDDKDNKSSSSSSSSSSSESSPPPSAKQMSKHFNQIDAHNVVQPGSKRAAAGKARAALHVAMEDKNQFDQEQKSSARKAGGAGGAGAVRRRSSQGRESGSPTKTTTATTKKRKIKAEASSDEEGDNQEEEEEDTKPVISKKARGKQKRASNGGDDDDGEIVEAPKKKKAKVVNNNLKTAQKEDATTQEGAVSSFDNPPKAKPLVKSKGIRIITTGLGLDKTSSEIKAMKPLGAVWTEKPQEATHLVVKNLSRTEKFLCCLPFTPFIVTKKWLDACIDAKELVDETPYLLKDKKKEAELGDTLEAILARAKKGKLLDGRKVYITKGVTPDLKAIQRIVSACGGIIAPNNLAKQHKNIVADADALVVSSPKDRREWDRLAGDGVPIYTCEAVFSAAMYQQFERGFTNAHRVDQQLTA
ncbi:hypothetical protein JCM11491_003452 [Sporobolomyces phaffii]